MLIEKAYDATVRLGVSTTTDDAEGEVVATTPASFHQPGLVEAEFLEQVGDILQVPTAVSAIKVDGKRAYQRVRDGEQVELKPRPVTIHSLVVHDQRVAGDWLDVDISVRCSSGTYIRAIARDAGAALGVGGHLTALRRTASGPFRVADAATVEDAAAALVADGGAGFLPLAEAATAVFPQRRLTPEEAVALGYGQRIPAAGAAGLTAATAPDGRLVALVEDAGETARVAVGFPPS
jgi:tRNA pseudouridine55 synthase